MSILTPEFFELITCETETGYAGGFRSSLEGAGFRRRQIRNENADCTVKLLMEWVEVFTVRIPEVAAE